VIGFLVGVAIGSMIVGRVAAVSGLLCGAGFGLFLSSKMPMPTAMGIGILCGIPIAFVANRIVGKIELSPFIVTLGMWGALRGASKGLGDNNPVYSDPTWIISLMKPADNGVFHFLPPGVWLMLLLALLVTGLLRYTQFGRHVYAVGSNQETARLCGVNVDRTKILVYGISSALAAVAAILQFAYLNGTGDPTTAEGYELKVIASVVIGGASLAGGEGSILGTIIGALIMTVVDNGCTKLGLDNWVQEIVTGGIILIAVAMDQLRHRRFAAA
jgi:ribose/xylose/arabinose/galactoside ABC-type transport system permease subunit